MIGQTIARYQVLERLGGGGMGVVYRAEDPRLRRHVALKFLPPDFTRDADARERFVREAQAASALDHDNICTIHEIGETDDGRLFIAMTCYDGETLKKKIARGPLPVEEAVRVARQVARGLAGAHGAGIIHRDVKPANVMVTEDGRVKLLDFGLAKLSGSVDLTKTGSTLGTVAYMSPEQARGEVVDARTDIWALGVMLYEMLTGQRPFQGDYAQAVIYALLNVDPAPLASVRQDVPQVLARVVEKALAKDADERYARIGDLLADLQAPRPSLVSEMPVAPAPRLFKPERPVVGRERERAQLHQALTSVAAGRGLIVGLAGEPGIGKTTLVETFLREVSADGPTCLVARGQCSERLAGAEAYLPLLDVLDSLRRQDPALAAAMRRLAPVWYLHIVPPTSAEAADPRLRADVQGATQERMKRELASFLEEIARWHPLVLVFEDLHWADVSTIDLLVHLAARFDGLRVLVVATYRPEDLRLAEHVFLKVKPDLQARGCLREVALGFLSRDEVEAYLALECPGHTFPGSFAKLIYNHTEGSPLFMADLVRDLRDRGVIEEGKDGWRLGQSVSEIELGLPESVQGMIERKIERLGEADRRFLVAASVQGYAFDSAVAAAVLGVDEEEVEDRLEGLEAVHAFVRYAGEVVYPGGGLTLRYRFVHALYQNALYGSLRPTKRARMSRAVAEALLGKYGVQSEAVASELAVLFEAARDYAQAAEYFCTAAQEAARVFAYQEAESLARRGLAQLEHRPETPERDYQELMLQMALGIPLTYTRGWGAVEAEQVYGRARELCRQVGETPQLASVLCGLAGFYANRSAYQTARELAEQVLHLAQREKDTILLLEAHHMMGDLLLTLGLFAPAREHYEWVVARYDRAQHGSRAYVMEDPGIGCLSVGATALWMLGYPDKAQTWAEEAVALAQALSHPFSLTFARGVLSTFRQFCRDVQATHDQAEATLVIADEQGFALWRVWGTMLLGWARAAKGQTEEGIVQISKGAAVPMLWHPYRLSLLADAYRQSKQVDLGLQALTEAFATVEKTDERMWEAELYRLKGALLLMQGGADAEAEECFHQALEVSRRQEAKSLELRAATSLARLWQQQGKQNEAYTLLRDVYGWFTEGFDTADLQDAKALLDDLQPSAPKEKPVPSIAVLPFANMSADPEQEYFCDGMAEEIIGALTQVRNLRVVARTSAFSFKGQNIDIREIGQTLNVEAVLEGSVRKAGNRLRITAQLVNVSDGYHLWSQRYDRVLEDVFAIQDEIALAIVEKLKVELLGAQQEGLVRQTTENMEAYSLYLLGRFHVVKYTEAEVLKAQGYFEQALTLDPNYVPAYWGLSLAYTGLHQLEVLPAKEAIPRAKAAVEHALALDPDHADAHAQLGLIYAWWAWNWEAARHHIQRALALNPNAAEVHRNYAHYLSAIGRSEEAISAIRQSIDLDPLFLLSYHNAAWHCYVARRFDESLAYCDHALSLDPHWGLAQWQKALVYSAVGTPEKAIAMLKQEQPLFNPVLDAAVLGYAYGRAGNQVDATRILDTLEARWQQGTTSAFFVAVVQVGLGNHEAAFESLDAATSERPAGSAWTCYLKGDPLWDDLRSDPRFTTLLEKMGLA